MARLSLALASFSMLSACIIEDPPPYREPKRTRPQLDMRLATPSQNRIIVVGQGDQIQFKVPFTSEDAGEPVAAFLFLDGEQENTSEVPAGTLDEVRTIEVTYTPSLARVNSNDFFGCHRFTLRVSHKDNFDIFEDGEPIDPADVSEATWWANVIDVAAGDDGSVLRNCPTGIVAP